MNVALAALFAASYAMIAFLHPREKAPVWFAVSYAVGMLTPISQLGLAFGAWPTLFMAAVFLTFSLALCLMVPALAVFYRRPVPWKLMAALGAATLLCAGALRVIPWGTTAFALIYQLPFMLATLACVWVVLKESPRGANDLVIAGLFALTSLHFPIKAAIAASLGTGVNPARYIASTYALLSQVSTGILLVATGLVLLISTVLSVLRETQIAAETDSLSGLLNRRGFEERAARILAERSRDDRPAALLLADIDHFKRVNDIHGHAGGDRALRWFASILGDSVPRSALVGRLGGEEFVILLDRTTRETARLQAEAIRHATLANVAEGIPPLTVSIGVTDFRTGDMLHTALERADAALYAAKDGGRNAVCLAPEAAAEPDAGNIVVLRRTGDA